MDMLRERPLSAVDTSMLFLCPNVDISALLLFDALRDNDCTRFGPLVTRLVEDKKFAISPVYADRSAIGRDRSCSANNSYSASRDGSPGCPWILANRVEVNNPSSPALTMPDILGTQTPLDWLCFDENLRFHEEDMFES